MDGRLSIGKLITFQLYWNLIQSGYQSLMSVLMSLTRASGAAQRVLTLVDALPDIDPHAGMKVGEWGVIFGVFFRVFFKGFFGGLFEYFLFF